jgi:enoyl-CoA hydratase/carnithine racemase
MEMLLTGRPISAERAAELGLVNRVVPADQLDAAVRELTDAIVTNSPLAIRLGKRAFHELRDLSEESAYEQAVEIMTANAVRHDAQEGISAFLEKRRPEWTGD